MTIEVVFENGCIAGDINGKAYNIGAGPVLKALVDNGHNIAVRTEYINESMRPFITNWFKKYGIYLIGENLNTKYINISISPKDISAHYIIGYYETKGKFLDWFTIKDLLYSKGLITLEQKNNLENKIKEELYNE